jgi:hypothetical protein
LKHPQSPALRINWILLRNVQQKLRFVKSWILLRNIHKAHILRDPLVFDHLFIDRTEDGCAVLNRSRIVPLNPTFTFAQRVEINRAVARCFLHPIDEAAPLALLEHIDHMISVIVVGLFLLKIPWKNSGFRLPRWYKRAAMVKKSRDGKKEPRW